MQAFIARLSRQVGIITIFKYREIDTIFKYREIDKEIEIAVRIVTYQIYHKQRKILAKTRVNR